MFSSIFGSVVATPATAGASNTNASSSSSSSPLSSRQLPKTWSDLSARRPLPIHFVLLPSKRSASSGSSVDGGGSISASGGSPLQEHSKKKSKKGGTSNAVPSSSAKNASAFSNLTPAWACHVPRGALPGAASLLRQESGAIGEIQSQISTVASASLASCGSSVTIWRILDPEHREPFVSFGALCEACGLSAMEGLVYFADILCRPVHRPPSSSAGSTSAETTLPSPQNPSLRGLSPPPSGASLIDLSLAGLEPCAELWIPLPAARKVAASCGVLEQLALLLSWSTRHAWSLDEGDGGVIHNWRVPPSVLPSASYSLLSLLSTPITAPIEILTRGTQVRTLVSTEERQRIERRWRADPALLLSSQQAASAGAAPKMTRTDAAQCGDLRMSLPDHNQETLLRWTVRVLDEYDEAQEMLLADIRDPGGAATKKPRSSGSRTSFVGSHARASVEDEQILQDLLFSASAEKMAQAGGPAMTEIRLSPNLASVLIFLRDISERIFHSTDTSQPIASRPSSNIGMSICNGSIRLTDKELAWLAQSSCSSSEESEEEESKLRVLRAKARVMLVHYVSVLYNRTGPPLADPFTQQQFASSANPSLSSRESASFPTSINSPPLLTSPSTAKRDARGSSHSEQFPNEASRQDTAAIQQMHAMTNARLQKLEQSVHRIESVLQILVKHVGADDHEATDAVSGEGPMQRRETRKVHFAGGTSDSAQPATKQAPKIVDPSTTAAEVPPYQLSNDQSPLHSHSQSQASTSSEHTPQSISHTPEPDFTSMTNYERERNGDKEGRRENPDTTSTRMQVLEPAWMLVSEIWGSTTRLLTSAVLLFGLSLALGRAISY